MLFIKVRLHDHNLKTLLSEKLDRDRVLQYTSAGTHKDDLIFQIGAHPIKKYGSQGQQKSFLIALKLAQFHFIKKVKQITPILLLDDIFDKLDESRVSNLVHLVSGADYGQIFISDTHSERTETVVQSTGLDYNLFQL